MLRRQKPLDLQAEFRQIGEMGRGLAHRPLLMWDWNDRLEPAEIRRQVRAFAGAGFRGFVIQPGLGLPSRPMDTEWLDAVEAAVDEARRYQLTVLFRERVQLPTPTALTPERKTTAALSRKVLRFDVLPHADPDSESFPTRSERTLAFYSAKQVDGRLIDCERLLPVEEEDEVAINPPLDPFVEALRENEAVVQRDADPPAEPPRSKASREPVATNSVIVHIYWEARDGLDPLDSAAVRTFMDGPMETYYREFGAEFGKTIGGFMMDVGGFDSIPWAPELGAIFSERYTGDLLEVLPCLFFEVEGWPAGRCQYWHTVSTAMARACTGQLQKWRRNREITLWAQFEGGGSLQEQMSHNAGLMPQMQVTSNTIITLNAKNEDNLFVFKQAFSIANQTYGSVLAVLAVEDSEIRTMASYHASSAAAVALGAGALCLSGALYSLSGSRQRRPGAYLYPDLPGWSCYPQLNRVLARLTFLMNHGQPGAGLAVIYPLRSAWQQFPAVIDSTEKALQEVCNTLRGAGVSWDILDETVLAEEGAVSRDRLQVRGASYQTVLIPPVSTLAASTLAVLEKLLDGGGSVFYVGSPAPHLDGQPSLKPGKILERAIHAADSQGFIDAINQTEWQVRVQPEASSMPVVWRHQDAGRYQFTLLANFSPHEATGVQVSMKGEGRLESWDCDTGVVTPLSAISSRGALSVIVSVPPGGQMILGLDTARPAWQGTSPGERIVQTIQLPGRWTLHTEDPNVLVMKEGSYKIGSEEWKPAAGLEEVDADAANRRGNEQLLLRYTLHLESTLHRKDLFLAVEDPARWNIVINGAPIPSKDSGWWRYESLRKFDVSRMLTPGKNVILLSCPVSILRERPATPAGSSAIPAVEGIYLLGRFSVDSIPSAPDSMDAKVRPDPPMAPMDGNSYIIGPLPREMSDSNLDDQGMPYFRGAVCLEQSILLPRRGAERIFLEIESVAAAAVEVRINGKAAGTLLWPPYRLDITDLARRGRNFLSVRAIHGSSDLSHRPFGVGQVSILFVEG